MSIDFVLGSLDYFGSVPPPAQHLAVIDRHPPALKPSPTPVAHTGRDGACTIHNQLGPTMITCTIRRAVTMLAMLAAPAMIFAAPLPASATSGAPLCETYGSYCVSADTLNPSQPVTPVVERSKSVAQPLIAVLQSGTFQGHAQYQLEFSANTSLCVTADVFNQVVVYYCSYPSGLWAKDGARWISVPATEYSGQDLYLAGLNNGTAYQLQPLGQSGYLYSFSWS